MLIKMDTIYKTNVHNLFHCTIAHLVEIEVDDEYFPTIVEIPIATLKPMFPISDNPEWVNGYVVNDEFNVMGVEKACVYYNKKRIVNPVSKGNSIWIGEKTFWEMV